MLRSEHSPSSLTAPFQGHSVLIQPGHPMLIQPFLIITIIINCIERRNSRFLPSPLCAVNCLQHVRSSGLSAIVCKSRATHQALITYNMLCATWYGGTAQLLSVTEFKSHLFSSFILMAETTTWSYTQIFWTLHLADTACQSCTPDTQINKT